MNRSKFAENATNDTANGAVWIQNYLVLPSVFVGLATYLFVLCTVIRNRNKYFNDPFYKICISLGVNDMMALVLYALMPLLIIYCQNMDRIFVWRAYLGRCFWYNSIYHSLLVAADRLFALALPHKPRWALHDKILNFLLFLSWSTSILSNVCIVTTLCPYIRYPKTNNAFYDFRVNGARLHNLIMDLGYQVVILIIIIVLYIISGYHVLKFSRRNSQREKTNGSIRRRKNKRKKVQWLYLLQGICVTLPTILTIILYHLIFYVKLTSAFITVIRIFSIVFGASSYYVNPFVYLALNSQLRKVIKQNVTQSCLWSVLKSSKLSVSGKTSNSIGSSEAATGGLPLTRGQSPDRLPFVKNVDYHKILTFNQGCES